MGIDGARARVREPDVDGGNQPSAAVFGAMQAVTVFPSSSSHDAIERSQGESCAMIRQVGSLSGITEQRPAGEHSLPAGSCKYFLQLNLGVPLGTSGVGRHDGRPVGRRDWPVRSVGLIGQHSRAANHQRLAEMFSSLTSMTSKLGTGINAVKSTMASPAVITSIGPSTTCCTAARTRSFWSRRCEMPRAGTMVTSPFRRLSRTFVPKTPLSWVASASAGDLRVRRFSQGGVCQVVLCPTYQELHQVDVPLVLM